MYSIFGMEHCINEEPEEVKYQNSESNSEAIYKLDSLSIGFHKMHKLLFVYFVTGNETAKTEVRKEISDVAEGVTNNIEEYEKSIDKKCKRGKQF